MGSGRVTGERTTTSRSGFFAGRVAGTGGSGDCRGGLEPSCGSATSGNALGFVKDCASVLEADVDAVWLSLAAPDPGKARASTRDLAGRFESARPRLEGLVQLMLEQYARLLLEV